MVFGKTAVANRSLTRQFDERRVHKKYIFLSDHIPSIRELSAKSALVRSGAKYTSRPPHAGASLAETLFTIKEEWIEAVPLTGELTKSVSMPPSTAFPFSATRFTEGSPAARLCLHAAELCFEHPPARSL